ncbi:MAG: hypothetical protein COA79_10400 [Planctomycetota bacterium]|nr:MAG: hypothetical protein COA79_10400 [Planctomycetota bacterium]
MRKNLSIILILILSSIFCHAEDTVLDTALEVDLRWNAKAVYIPLFSILVSDDDGIVDDKEIEDDLKNGNGYGLYIGLDIFDSYDIETMQMGFGFIYQTTKHKTSSGSYTLDADTLLFEVNSYLVFFDSDNFKIFQQVGLSAGFVDLNFDDVREDFTTGMIANRYLLNFDCFNHILFNIGGGIYAWGQPGKTHAYGGYFILEIGFRF